MRLCGCLTGVGISIAGSSLEYRLKAAEVRCQVGEWCYFEGTCVHDSRARVDVPGAGRAHVAETGTGEGWQQLARLDEEVTVQEERSEEVVST